MASFVFLCDSRTERECLDKRLAGTTQANALWAVRVQPSDTLFLYNFHSGIVHGPLKASGSPDLHDPHAWGGQFPIQVPFERLEVTRSLRAADLASSATMKVLRHGGLLSEAMCHELYPQRD